MSKAKEFIKNSGIYFAGKVLTLLVTIFLLPLFTKHVSTRDYGNYELVRSFTNLLIPFLCAECWKAFFRLAFTPKFKNEKEKLFSTSLYFSFICDCIISVGLFFVFRAYGISRVLPIVLIFSETINFLYQYVSRSLNKNFIFAFSGIIGSLVNVIVGVVCIFGFKNAKDAMFLALIASQLAQTILIFFATKGWRFFNFKYVSFDVFKDIFKFAWPFGLTTLVYYFSNGFNTLLIKTFLDSGVDKVAIYAIALKFIAVVTLFASVIEMAWADVLYKIEDENERREYMNRWLSIGFKVFCVSGLLMLFVIKFMFPFLVGEDYLSAWDLMPILYLSTFFLMANNMLLNPCRAENKSWLFLVCKTVNAIISVSLFFILFKKYDLIAICIAFTSGMIGEYICYQILDKKFLKLDFQIIPAVLFVVFYLGFAFFIFKYSLMLNSILFIVLLILSYIYLRKDLDSVTNHRFKILKKIHINRNVLIYIIISTIIYQTIFWLAYNINFENKMLNSIIFFTSLFSFTAALFFIYRVLKIDQDSKKKSFFWVFLGNLIGFGFILVALKEFNNLHFNNTAFIFSLICMISINLLGLEVLLGDINEKTN